MANVESHTASATVYAYVVREMSGIGRLLPTDCPVCSERYQSAAQEDHSQLYWSHQLSYIAVLAPFCLSLVCRYKF